VIATSAEDSFIDCRRRQSEIVALPTMFTPIAAFARNWRRGTLCNVETYQQRYKAAMSPQGNRIVSTGDKAGGDCVLSQTC
jgi:hypothetical protein